MPNTAAIAAATATTKRLPRVGLNDRLLAMVRTCGTKRRRRGYVGQADRIDGRFGRLFRRACFERNDLAGDIDLVARGVGHGLRTNSMSEAGDLARPEDPPDRPAASAQQRIAVLRRIEGGRRGACLRVVGGDR